MSADPSSPSEDPGKPSGRPPARRPEDLEDDFWDLGDEEAVVPEPSRQQDKLPAKTDDPAPPVSPEPRPAGSPQAKGISRDVLQSGKPQPLVGGHKRADFAEDLGDLDEAVARPVKVTLENEFKKPGEAGESAPKTPVAPAARAGSAPGATQKDGADDASAKPVMGTFADFRALIRSSTWLEKVGLLMVLVLVLAFAVGVFFPSIGNLPAPEERMDSSDFPVAGSHLAVKAAETYWREPMEDDVVSRGTMLLPVLKLQVGDGTGALRILFRTADGTVVGDPVTRSVRSGDSLMVAGSKGFDSEGMHAAYRTGQEEPWIVQVFEAATTNAAPDDYALLFEMNLSTALK